MVKLRLKRLGRKMRPFYRIVAMPATSPRDGKPLEELGFYDPVHAELTVDAEATLGWLNRGAQMTDTVRSLLRSQGILARWRGAEGTVRENVLAVDKPKRRKKLSTAEKAADTPDVAAPASDGPSAPPEAAAPAPEAEAEAAPPAPEAAAEVVSSAPKAEETEAAAPAPEAASDAEEKAEE